MTLPRATGDTPLWRHAPDVAQVRDDQRYVVLDLARPEIPPRVLSGPAALIWAAVDNTRDTAAVATAVAEEVGASPDELLADVTAFLTELHESGLLSGPAGAAA